MITIWPSASCIDVLRISESSALAHDLDEATGNVEALIVPPMHPGDPWNVNVRAIPRINGEGKTFPAAAKRVLREINRRRRR